MIDIMVPFYGSARWLREAVASVREQSSADWRLTVIDDAYPDVSAAGWVSDIDDPRVTLLRNSKNLGINANFRRCIAEARSPYVAVMGGDDALHRDYVAACLNAMRPRASLVAFQPQVEVIDSEGHRIRPLADRIKALNAPRPGAVVGGELAAVRLFRGNWSYFPAICWRRTAIADEDFSHGWNIVLDMAMHTRLLRRGGEFMVGETVQFRYRRHGGNASAPHRDAVGRFREEREFFREESRLMQAHGWPKAARAAQRHATSRLHAASLLPGVLGRGEATTARALVSHVIERT